MLHGFIQSLYHAYDTRSIFKRIKASSNTDFPFPIPVQLEKSENQKIMANSKSVIPFSTTITIA